MKTGKIIAVAAMASLLMAALADVQAAVLTVGSASGGPGESVEIRISVTPPEQVAGAAFTVTYDNTRLTLNSVESTFFDTFHNQWVAFVTPPITQPDSVEVDGVVYDQPLVANDVSGGTMIAGARCAAGSSDPVLFTLTFAIDDAAPAGDYTVNVIPSIISNTDAGYSADGEAIAYLVGGDPSEPDLTQAFAAVPVTQVNPGQISVVILDTDHDGIPDAIENGHACLKYNDPDSDDDGLTDGSEDANQNGVVDEGETDPCSADSDGDGMDDGYEVAQGLKPLDKNDALEDDDEDGYSNLYEYLAGTAAGDDQDQPTVVIADQDDDQDCDGVDLTSFEEEYSRGECSEAQPCAFDLDHDGDVDEVDFALMAENFGKSDSQ